MIIKVESHLVLLSHDSPTMNQFVFFSQFKVEETLVVRN